MGKQHRETEIHVPTTNKQDQWKNMAATNPKRPVKGGLVQTGHKSVAIDPITIKPARYLMEEVGNRSTKSYVKQLLR